MIVKPFADVVVIQSNNSIDWLAQKMIDAVFDIVTHYFAFVLELFVSSYVLAALHLRSIMQGFEIT